MLSEERATGAPELSIYQDQLSTESAEPVKMCMCGALVEQGQCPTCVLGEREYKRVHQVIAVSRGSASRQQCACGAAAAQWAYNNACDREQTDSRGRRWCPHPKHYDAMCYPCHRDMDGQRRTSEQRV